MVGGSVGREASVGRGAVSVAGGGGVAVKTAGAAAWGEQDARRKRIDERRIRDVRRGGMEVF
jgi:hypothetical protein